MRENVISLRVSHGFLSVDAYINDVLKGISSQAGAEILVTSTLHWEHDGYDLAVEIFDVAKAKKLNQFQAKIPRIVADSSGMPLIFKDPDSGVSLALIGSAPSNHAADVHPTCVEMPRPAIYTSGTHR
jgi:hypothetical protein